MKKKKKGICVKTVSSAKEALKLLDREDFDCVVSDYQMPGMDGLEFLEVVRKERDSKIPFIIFTGKGREEVAMKALNLGADRYLQKRGDPKSQYGVLAKAITQEAEHKKILERLKLISYSLENINHGALWITKNGTIQYANKEICKKLEYNRGEIIGKTVSDIDLIFPNDRPEVWRQIKQKGSKTFQSKFKTKNGNTIPVEITSHYLEKEGKEYAFTFVQDITEKKKIKEREKFSHNLLRHDVRNKCQTVKGYLELSKDHDLPEELENYLNKAEKAVRDSVYLIEKVRTLQEITEQEEQKQIDIDTVIENIVTEQKDQAKNKNIQIKHQNIDCKVIGSPLLQELFRNIVENSIKHSNCNKIKITGKQTKKECIITIEDDGKGIPDKNKNKIFQRGYQKGETGGTGLGLYLAKKITENYNGTIKIKDSELGGTKFQIKLKKP